MVTSFVSPEASNQNVLALVGFGADGWGFSLLTASGVTIAAAACGFGLGTVLGIIGARLKLSAVAPFRWIGNIYTTIFRGLPEILVIYVFYFGSSLALTRFLNYAGYAGFLSAPSFVIGVVSIGIVSGAYQTETYRAAFQRIERGQIEAGRACGMSDFTLLWRIIAPQTLRFALPALANIWQSVIKETALLSVISLIELLREASLAAGSTQQPLLFYGLAGLIYLTIGRITGFGFVAVEKHLAVPWKR